MRKSKFFWILLLVATLSGTNLCQAQEEVVADENPFSVGVDIMSRYVWRGTDFGASPSIQPAVSVSKWGLTLGAWGAYATNKGGIQEADLYLSYSIKDMISITVTDYFFPDEINGYKYFNYDGDQTGHVFEGSISFNGTEKLPLTLLFATNFYGADARRINEDGTTGKIQYSTYAELGYAFKYFEAFMGFNLTTPDTDKGEAGFYGSSFGVVNLGVSAAKEIQITEKFSLPVSVSLITNPQKERIYLVAGFTF